MPKERGFKKTFGIDHVKKTIRHLQGGRYAAAELSLRQELWLYDLASPVERRARLAGRVVDLWFVWMTTGKSLSGGFVSNSEESVAVSGSTVRKERRDEEVHSDV